MNARIVSLSFAIWLMMSGAWAVASDTLLRHRILELQRATERALLNQTGEALYRPAKALAWLDFALHEHYEDDRTNIVEHAIAEAERLLAASTREAAFETPLPGAAEFIRADLWTKATALRQHHHFHCAAREIAQLEVQLVWAGHEKWESGWSHARLAVEVAENLAYEAEQAQRSCLSPASAPNVEKLLISGDALFPLNKDNVKQIGAAGRARLEAFADGLKKWKSIERIEVVGHTDRLGSTSYNDSLSLRRAENIRAHLIERGLPAGNITALGQGANKPVKDCQGPDGFVSLAECLQPNRRVEINVSGER